MINDDSPILDFYPPDFEIDMNGKKMAWQGVALLPFIDQTRLLDALGSKEDELTEDEKRRNRWGDNVLFVARDNRLYESFCDKLYGLRAKAATKVSFVHSNSTDVHFKTIHVSIHANKFLSPCQSTSTCRNG